MLCRWENLQNRQCIKYLFSPLSNIYTYIHTYIQVKSLDTDSLQCFSFSKTIKYIFEIIQSSHPLPWWQLCTHFAFSHPASPVMLLQWSWRSSHMPITYWLLFPSICRPTHPKPSQLGWGRWLWRPGHLMQHSITRLRANQMGWDIVAECCASHAG